MGDAAHATTPNLGQGACMAIEDAVVLANCLAENAVPQQAFEKFESRRLGRTRKIVNGSWRLGRVAQWESPLLTWFRNAAVRATPARVTEKQMQFITDISFQ
jgi:2-polyprenyl-6-methoxyphenol hydroxylase-like FAD-dependent oxidoreductase